MSEKTLEKLFEHNNWANLQIIRACAALSDDQLDAAPQSATKGSIRLTLSHLVTAQQNYLLTLTLPLEARLNAPPVTAHLQEAVSHSGEGLLALARDEAGKYLAPKLQTKNGYLVEPWVIMVQAINHASEHREQICSMLTALGVTPPDLDGWAYGEVTNALVPDQ